MITFKEWAKQNKLRLDEYMADFFKDGDTNDNTPSHPKTGDRAYSIYHGQEAEGVLEMSPNGRTGRLIAKNNPWFKDNMWGKKDLEVGYDKPIEWDHKRNMWYAPADVD